MYEVMKSLLLVECKDILKSSETTSAIISVCDAEQGTCTYYREATDVDPMFSANRFLPSYLIIKWSGGIDGNRKRFSDCRGIPDAEEPC
jgi:hypothetical protein